MEDNFTGRPVRTTIMDSHKDILDQCSRASTIDNAMFDINSSLNWCSEQVTNYGSAATLVVVLAVLLFMLYRSFINPEVYRKELTEIGFEHIAAGPDRGLRVARAQTARKLGTKIPPPYPNGWFAVAESRDLKVGGVLAVDALGFSKMKPPIKFVPIGHPENILEFVCRCFSSERRNQISASGRKGGSVVKFTNLNQEHGQNLCVYRGEDGVAHVVDAYCPHLGAHLAIGGTVCGSCIECPFHKWRFGADGALVSVPDVETVPKGVSIKSWTTVEADAAIWIWHDAEDRPPLWELEDAPELKTWAYRGHNDFVVGCHIQEIPENGADVAHLNAVHSTSLVSQLAEKYPVLLNLIGRHLWNAEWKKGPEEHTTTIKLTHDYKIMKMNVFHVDVDVTQIGPGHVRLRLSTPLGPALISQSVTPIGPLQQRVIHRMFSPTYNAPAAVIFNRAESYQFERDVAIWNSKRYVGAPAYVKSDKTIRAFRTWFSQFYSENSVTFAAAITNPLDW